MTKTYYLALNRRTKQYFIGRGKTEPWKAFRYEHKTLENAGDYEDYTYYQFDDLDKVCGFIFNCLMILSNGRYAFERFALLNKQNKYRLYIKQNYFIRNGITLNFVKYIKTDRGYVFEVEYN